MMHSKVQVKSGTLNENIIPDDAIVVIEDYDQSKREIPQQEMIDNDRCLNRQYRLVHGSSLKCYYKLPLGNSRIYGFVKTDDENQTFAGIKALEVKLKELTQINEKIKEKTVYMQRLSFDTYDCGKAMLEQLDMKAVYFTGEQKPVPKDDKFLFRIDFTPAELFEYCKRRIKGQDKELEKAVYYIWDFIHSAALGINKPVQNWMLTAPSGMGKTEFFRCIEDFFADHDIPVPVIRFDLNEYSPTSFKGKELNDIPGEIKAHQKMTHIDPSIAICFFDESDKRMMPNYTSKGEDLNASIQSEILTLVEGKKTAEIDSSKTMFVFLGAFQYLRDSKQKEVRTLKSGFRTDGDPISSSEVFYDNLTLDDMIEQGMIEELAGRITSVINFHRIDERQMKNIIRDKAKQIGDEMGYRIRITDKGLKELMQIAYTNLGVRKPMNVIRELAIGVIAHQTIFGAADKGGSEIVISGLEKAKLKKDKAPEDIRICRVRENACESA